MGSWNGEGGNGGRVAELLHPGAVGIAICNHKMVVLRMIDADMFAWWGAQVLIDGHEILGMASCMYEVGLINFISDLKEDAEDLMGRVGWWDVQLVGCRHWYLGCYCFSLIVHEWMFFCAAEDRCDVPRHFAQIASMPLMDFISLDLDRCGGQIADSHTHFGCSRMLCEFFTKVASNQMTVAVSEQGLRTNALQRVSQRMGFANFQVCHFYSRNKEYTIARLSSLAANSIIPVHKRKRRHKVLLHQRRRRIETASVCTSGLTVIYTQYIQ